MDTTNKKHALLGASSAHRWLNCPPSARMCALLSDRPSEYAEEGTCAHALAAARLKGYAGWDNSAELAEFNALAAKYHTLEMEDAACEYAAIVYNAYQEACVPVNAELAVEQRVDYSAFVPEGFGTADAIVINNDTLRVFDFKYGKGVRIDAERNPQLMLYALGALAAFPDYHPEIVLLTIVQPRVGWDGHVDIWATSREELLRWAREELRPKAEDAWHARGLARPGEWCQFCKALGLCKSVAELAVKTAAKYAESQLLQPAEVAEMLPAAARARKWAERLEADALGMALAGTALPGYKLVEGRSARKIADHAAAIEALADAGYDRADVTKPTEALSITELERKIGKKALAEIVGPYIVKPAGKPCLAPESDSRKAISTDLMDNLIIE